MAMALDEVGEEHSWLCPFELQCTGCLAEIEVRAWTCVCATRTKGRHCSMLPARPAALNGAPTHLPAVATGSGNPALSLTHHVPACLPACVTPPTTAAPAPPLPPPPQTKEEVCRHRELDVLLCVDCHASTREPPATDDDGCDDACRWCGHGGGLVCCDSDGCPRSYCEQCICRNSGEARFEQITAEDAAPWQCYSCQPNEALEHLRAEYDKIQRWNIDGDVEVSASLAPAHAMVPPSTKQMRRQWSSSSSWLLVPPPPPACTKCRQKRGGRGGARLQIPACTANRPSRTEHAEGVVSMCRAAAPRCSAISACCSCAVLHAQDRSGVDQQWLERKYQELEADESELAELLTDDSCRRQRLAFKQELESQGSTYVTRGGAVAMRARAALVSRARAAPKTLSRAVGEFPRFDVSAATRTCPWERSRTQMQERKRARGGGV